MKNNSTTNTDICETPNTPNTPNTPVVHILIVEDNQYISKNLNCLLRKKGYKCLLASNASEAMAQYQAYQIPLILLDLEIPETHGTNIAKQMKDLKKQHSTTIIAFSKYHRNTVEQSLALESNDIIDAYIRDYRNQEDIINIVTNSMPITSFTRQLTTNSESLDLEPVTPETLEDKNNIKFNSFKCSIL